MAQYQVQDPQGQMHIIEGPDGATPDQVMSQAQSLIPSTSSGDGSSQFDVAKAAMSSVSNLAPWNKAYQAAKNVGGDIAEGAGYLGAKIANNTNKYVPNMPTLGGFVQGTGVVAGAVPAIGPDVLAAYAGIRGLRNPQNPVGVGLSNSTQDLSPQYSIQNEAVGIANRPPEQSGSLKFSNPYGENQLTSKPPPAIQTDTTFPSNLRSADALPSTTPIKYPTNPATLVNTANDRVTQFGTKLNQQELADYRALLDQNIGDPNKIPQFIGKAKNPLYAQASAVRAKVNDVLNQVVDPQLANVQLPDNVMSSRTGLNQAYGIAAKRQQLGQLLKKYGIIGSEAVGTLGGIGSGAYALYKGLSK